MPKKRLDLRNYAIQRKKMNCDFPCVCRITKVTKKDYTGR